MRWGTAGCQHDNLWDLHVCVSVWNLLYTRTSVCEDKVCREGKELLGENWTICSVQGLCLDLVYFSLLSLYTRWARSLLFLFSLQGSILAPNPKEIFIEIFSVRSLFFFLHAWQESGFTSNELFRVAHLLTVDAVNSCLNPIMRHDMQVSCSILKQVNWR